MSSVGGASGDGRWHLLARRRLVGARCCRSRALVATVSGTYQRLGVSMRGYSVTATGLSVGLALADCRADLATLAAVGASPKFRRRVTAGQAGVIAIIGTVTGVVTGIALSYVLGWWAAENFGYGDDWRTIIPWPTIALGLVAIPALAIIGGWLFTRSRLPVIRRAAS